MQSQRYSSRSNSEKPGREVSAVLQFEKSPGETLLPKKENSAKPKRTEEDKETFGCWYRMKRGLGLAVSLEKRTIQMNGHTTPASFLSNRLNN